MGKKNKSKKYEETGKSVDQRAQQNPQQSSQPQRQQGQENVGDGPRQRPSHQIPQELPGSSRDAPRQRQQQGGRGQRQQPPQQQPQQQQPQSGRGQQQQRPPQQQPQSGQGQQQQRPPQQQPQQQQRPPQQQPQSGRGQQQQRPPQQQPQSGQGQQQPQQQQRPPQQQPQSGQGQQQQRSPQQQPQQQQRPPQQQPQQQQQPQSGWGQQQQRPPQQQPQQQQQPQSGWGQQQQRPPQQQPQQHQRPAQQQPQQQQQPQSGWGQQQQRPPQQQPQQQQRPQQRQQQGGLPRQPQTGGHLQQQQHRASSTSSIGSNTSLSNIPRGTIGRPGIVEANYLRLNLNNMPSVAYHYDVTITPGIPKKFLRPAFEQFNQEFFANVPMAYDGQKSFYTVKRLDIKNEFTKDIELSVGGKANMKFNIVIKETEDIEIKLDSLRNYLNDRIFDKPMRALQCLEVVLANACHKRGVRAGRSFYNPPNPPMDLGEGFELWLGLYQAMILGDTPLLNVDIAHKSFPKEMSVIEYLNGLARGRVDTSRKLEPHMRTNLLSFLKTLRIVYNPPTSFGVQPKEFTVHGVSEESASERMFTMDDGKRMSVAEYFRGRGCKLQYPQLNCLLVGSTVKMISLPVEFCKIKGSQAIRKKDGTRVVQNMIKFAATSTDVRKKKIMSLLHTFHSTPNDIVRSFGLDIVPNFIDVPIRVLNAPFVEYFNRETLRVSNGSWRMGNRTQFLMTVPKVHKWAVLYHKTSRSVDYCNLQSTLVRQLQDAARQINLNLDPKPLIDSFIRIEPKLMELKKEKYDLVIVVIPFKGTSYADIKQAAELKCGLLTQCIKEDTVVRRCNMQLAVNLLLKINAKLNGTNHKIEAKSHVSLQNVMYLGADVTHPSPDQTHIPSVVGVAASHDPNGACYNMQYRLQESAAEIIKDMDLIFTHHMKVYFKNHKRYPDHVIYYRDGVSDGQFPIVKREELRSMQVACNRLGAETKITCIVAVKRHHTRFFPKEKTNDKFNNVDPGTVVDRVIVHPNEKQFFMVSHQSIQGTAKPTRYNIIETNIDINVLQQLTHNLCHLFPRCNRAVSYPTPVYLAHLVAFRGRVYLEGTQRFGDLKEEYNKRSVHSDIMNLNPMYFV